MKKLVVFLFIISLVVGGFYFSDQSSQIFAVAGVDKVCFVSSDKFEGDFETVQCGEKFFNFCTFEEARAKASLIRSSDAVQLYAEEARLDTLLKKIRFQELFCEEVDGIDVSYGYSPCYDYAIMLDGKKVNVQVARIDGNAIVGFPMIMTGF